MKKLGHGNTGPAVKLYGELAEWWPLISSPADYAPEAARFHELIRGGCANPPHTLLELGSGGGNNALHLKLHYQMTLVDVAPGMLDVSRALNPECEHLEGDMRSLRLERTFDAVFVHDAVQYMTTEADLEAAIATAYVHCNPGGAAVFVPDFVRETFRPGTDFGGHDGDDGRGARYLDWSYDLDPSDTTYNVEFAVLLRDASGEVRSVHDRHTFGIFPRDTWLDALRAVGFDPEIATDRWKREIFVGRR
jgi:ubiquinone/menaquinone biosynthesis C-methylase UbiE